MFDKLGRGHVGTALLAAMLTAACGGGDDTGGAPAAGGAGGAGAPAASPVDAATAGSISGHIMFTGTPAAPEPIDMADEPQCASKHASPPQKVRADVSNGGLNNVFVYVKSGPVTSMQFPTPTETELLDQDGCIYMPHIVGLQTGQTLTVRNSDPLMHNVNATPTNNRPFNRSQPQAGMEFQQTFSAAEVMIPVRCDVHGWMESYIGVTGHPYHAVSANGGTFSLANLPPGEYEIEAWHELYGTQTQMVTVPASGQADVMFTFTEQMAGNFAPKAAPLYVDHATGTLRTTPPSAHSHTGHQ